jgi:hypothetical protein
MPVVMFRHPTEFILICTPPKKRHIPHAFAGVWECAFDMQISYLRIKVLEGEA